MERETSAKTKQVSFEAKLESMKSAFVSTPKDLQSPKLMVEIRRAFSSAKIRNYEGFIPSRKQYRQKLKKYLRECDALIVAFGEDRKVVGGVYRELLAAMSLKKMILLWNIKANTWERFVGIQMDPTGMRVGYLKQYVQRKD